jgi:subtilisin family serine protease
MSFTANAVVDRASATRRILFQESCTSMKVTASSSTGRGNLPSSDPLALVGLPPVMQRTGGRSDIMVALIDGPVMAQHPDLVGANIHAVGGVGLARCGQVQHMACAHGTFIAGILSAVRGSKAPAIAPECTLLVRPVFSETSLAMVPSATPREVANAIFECVQAGARLLNLSAAFAEASMRGERELQDSLDHAVSRGAIVVAAAGNQGSVSSSPITRHPGVIPVAGYSLAGRPLLHSNLGGSIGRRGLGGPGEGVVSIGGQPDGGPAGGTSVAAPFVTGALALLWSEFPKATATQVKWAALYAGGPRRSTIAPPLLDATQAYRLLASQGAAR